jgi:ComF family protein
MIARYLTSAIAPPVCVLCGGPGQGALEPSHPGAWGFDLCTWCESACPRPPEKPANAPEGCDALHCLFIYAAPVDRLVTQLKFGHDPAPARVLGMLMARECRSRDWELPGCIVPMPLHPRRLGERGFNQAREIARHLAPRIRVPIEARALHRRRHTLAQSGLTAAERRVNVIDAFSVDECRVIPQHVALLDDVMTTGSTLAAAASALKSAGVRRVDAWVVARAMRGDASDRLRGDDPRARSGSVPAGHGFQR